LKPSSRRAQIERLTSDDDAASDRYVLAPPSPPTENRSSPSISLTFAPPRPASRPA
jgi:hypothetical protein